MYTNVGDATQLTSRRARGEEVSSCETQKRVTSLTQSHMTRLHVFFYALKSS